MLNLNKYFYVPIKLSVNDTMPLANGANQAKQITSSSSPLLVIFSLLLTVISFQSKAIDIVTVNVGESNDDKRILFKNEVVKLALEITKDEYGEYKILENPQRMNIARAFRELEKGENLSLTFAHTRPEFEKMATPIRVSIRGGIDSYRLLMIRKGQQARFEDIKTVEDLKQFTVGLSPNWSTHKIMANEGFQIVDTANYSSMFRMLELGRYDFMPRAINEVYDELGLYKPIADGIEIMPKIALYIPSVSYMFVSPKQPRIFQRLNSGLHAISINGDLSKLTDKYYRKSIERAKIQNRRVITISNTEFSHLPSLIQNDLTSD